MVDEEPPYRWLWTREAYHRAGEINFFPPTLRVELLNGKIYEKVSPQSFSHATGVSFSAVTLKKAFGEGVFVQQGKPVVLSEQSEPEPDVTVVRGNVREMVEHPTAEKIALLLEVSDLTVEFDQSEKAEAYARANILDYWILNLPQRQLEVRRDPQAMETGKYAYQTQIVVPEDGEIAPLALPETPIRVADLLPLQCQEEADQATLEAT